MIEHGLIEKLRAFKGSTFQVLSVYLGTDAVQAPTGEFLTTQLHSLVHQNLTKENRTAFQDDIERIEKYLQKHTPSARSIIFFSAGGELWEVINLEFSLPTSISIETSPDLYPLTQGLKKYSKYLVLLVDREKARMFTVEQGEIVQRSEYTDSDVPQKVSATRRDGANTQTDINFRHNEVLLGRHIDLAAKAVDTFAKNDDIHFVIIGGHKEMFKKVIKSLPADLRAKVVGTFVSELNVPLAEILHESKKIAAQEE